MCTACKMNHGPKRMGDTSDAHEELARRVAAKAGHPAVLQARAGEVASDGKHAGTGYVEEPPSAAPPKPNTIGKGDTPQDHPGDKGPQGWDVKHIHITDNVWREPATWLAAALALSAVATVTTAIIYTRAKG